MYDYMPGKQIFRLYRSCYSLPENVPPATPANLAQIAAQMPAYKTMKVNLADWEEQNGYLLERSVTRELALDNLKAYAKTEAEKIFVSGNPGLANLIKEYTIKHDYEVKRVRKIEAAISNSRIFKDLHPEERGFNFLHDYHTLDELFKKLESHFFHNLTSNISQNFIGWLGIGAGLGTLERIGDLIETLSPIEVGIITFGLGFGLYLIDELCVKPFHIEKLKEEVKATLGKDSQNNEINIDDVIQVIDKTKKILDGLTEAQLELAKSQIDAKQKSRLVTSMSAASLS